MDKGCRINNPNNRYPLSQINDMQYWLQIVNLYANMSIIGYHINLSRSDHEFGAFGIKPLTHKLLNGLKY